MLPRRFDTQLVALSQQGSGTPRANSTLSVWYVCNRVILIVTWTLHLIFAASIVFWKGMAEGDIKFQEFQDMQPWKLNETHCGEESSNVIVSASLEDGGAFPCKDLLFSCLVLWVRLCISVSQLRNSLLGLVVEFLKLNIVYMSRNYATLLATRTSVKL